MTSVTSLIIAALSDSQNALLVADENCKELPFDTLPKSVKVLTNRFDIALLAQAAGLDTQFSDFDFTPFSEAPPSRIVYPVSKEKAVVHHVANRVADTLATGAELLLIGSKQQGTKTFAKTLARRFGSTAAIEKNGSNYLVSISKKEALGPPLDDTQYQKLRAIFELDQTPVFSKPGTFGWDKIDQGSQLLADHLETFLGGVTGTAILDLGCGYGYLSLQALRAGRHIGREFQVVATDNCAAALLACRKNFEEHRIKGEVIASDGGAGLKGSFNAILCNPPFHQGFRTDSNLTQTFLKGARQLLAKGGRALFVVNQFVPLESLASPLFPQVSEVTRERGFKLITLS